MWPNWLVVFMNATLKVAVHLGNDHDENLRNVKNSSWGTTGQLFGETEKLISGQTETTGTSLIDSKDLRWTSTSLLHSRAPSIRHCQGLCLFRLGAVCGENGRRPHCDLEEIE